MVENPWECLDIREQKIGRVRSKRVFVKTGESPACLHVAGNHPGKGKSDDLRERTIPRVTASVSVVVICCCVTNCPTA